MNKGKKKGRSPDMEPQPLKVLLAVLALALLLAFGILLGLPGTSLGRLYAPLPPGEHRVHKVHVGVYRLPGERLSGLHLALLLAALLLAVPPAFAGCSC